MRNGDYLVQRLPCDIRIVSLLYEPVFHLKSL